MDKKDWLILVALYALAMGVFAQTFAHGWANIDDGLYVYENAHIRTGLTVEGLKYAFTQSHGANWHPLTTLSHMIDVQFFGMNPNRHHIASVILHVANTLLLYVFLKLVTKNAGPSAFAAALFAVHPAHVESVAWIASRKDVLSTLFWLACMLAYLRYTKLPGVRRYCLVTFLMILALMSKPMAVTIPFALLCLDLWPLKRVVLFDRGTLWKTARLIFEKVPLFAFAFLSGIATLWAQSREGAVSSLELIPMRDRLANAAVSYCLYVKNAFLPTELSIFYPHLGKNVSNTEALIALTALIIVSVVAIALARKAPWVTAGWFWFSITLLPVIGIIQVGFQGMADRYTYVPYIGLFIAVTWTIYNVSSATIRHTLWLPSSIAIVHLAILAYQQAKLWENGVKLWERAAVLYPNDARCHNGYGSALLLAGQVDQAVVEIKKALELDNKSIAVNSNMGQALAEQGRFEEALPYYRIELGFDPEKASVRVNLGNALLALERVDEAKVEFEKAIQTNANLWEAYLGLGAIFLIQGDNANAASTLEQATRLAPDSPEAWTNLALAYHALGRNSDAVNACKRALAANPGFEKANALLRQIQSASQ
jgi:tetratricopeptide (TPR) repeat protein